MKYIKLLIINILLFLVISCNSGNSSNNSINTTNESSKIFAYAANDKSGIIETFLFESKTGNLLKLNLTESLRPLSSYFLLKSNKLPFIFINSMNNQSRIIYTYKNNKFTGQLLFQNQITIDKIFNGILFTSIDDKFLYVNKDNQLIKYTINLQTGLLSLASESIVDIGSKLLDISYNVKNNNYYVLSKNSESNFIIKVFSYNPNNGNLTNLPNLTYSFIEGDSSQLLSPSILHFDTNSKYLLALIGITGDTANDRSMLCSLKVESDGSLTKFYKESFNNGAINFNISSSNYVYLQITNVGSTDLMLLKTYKLDSNGLLTPVLNSNIIFNDISDVPGIFSPNYLYYYILPNLVFSNNIIYQYRFGESGQLIPLIESKAYSIGSTRHLLFTN